ncbi:MAG TPA: hypothetical protein DCL35_08665 [Candidatus Omnitrophica bacterium]|nr:hypothetical protein [Candidatus Omnitrophota bacterium]
MKAKISPVYRALITTLFVFLIAACASSAFSEEYVFKNQGKRDPFVPLITPAGYLVNLEPADENKISLEGIMYDPKGDSMAIINGELVRAGDVVGSALVSSIEPNKVVIIQDNEKIEIELRRGE